jgi:hypothetical protein
MVLFSSICLSLFLSCNHYFLLIAVLCFRSSQSFFIYLVKLSEALAEFDLALIGEVKDSTRQWYLFLLTLTPAP